MIQQIAGRASLRAGICTSVLLMLSACGPVPAPLATGATALAKVPTAAPVGAPKPSTTRAAAAPLANCQEIMQANLRLGRTLPQLVNLTAATDYSALTRADSPFLVDFKKFRSDLDTLATLPEPADKASALLGTPADSVAYFRSLADVAEADIKAKGAPITVNNSSGQKVIGLDTAWLVKVAAFGPAMDRSCQGVQLVIAPPASAATYSGPTFKIGQTAPQGDMRITLDKVETVPGGGGILADNGARYVIFYATVMNAGSTPLSVPFTTFPMVSDKGGKLYAFDSHTIMLREGAYNNDIIAVDVAPGKSVKGSIGYMLPITIGDLTWRFIDQDRAPVVFQVGESEIAVVGTPLTSAARDKIRTGSQATVEAIMTMAAQQDALNAASTAQPGAPAPTDVPEPTDVPDMAETPVP